MPAEASKSGASRWLTIVGIGEDGVAGLGDEAKRRIAEAEIVFGGKRHLALVAAIVTGESRPWPSPFDPEMREVLAQRGKKVCVLASGDPFFHGVGVTLARHVPADEMLALPAPSSLSLAASRLGWALQDVETVSLHGRPLDLDTAAAPPEAPHTGADFGRRWPGRGGSAADRTRFRQIAADRAGSAWRTG